MLGGAGVSVFGGSASGVGGSASGGSVLSSDVSAFVFAFVSVSVDVSGGVVVCAVVGGLVFGDSWCFLVLRWWVGAAGVDVGVVGVLLGSVPELGSASGSVSFSFLSARSRTNGGGCAWCGFWCSCACLGCAGWCWWLGGVWWWRGVVGECAGVGGVGCVLWACVGGARFLCERGLACAGRVDKWKGGREREPASVGSLSLLFSFLVCGANGGS